MPAMNFSELLSKFIIVFWCSSLHSLWNALNIAIIVIIYDASAKIESELSISIRKL